MCSNCSVRGLVSQLMFKWDLQPVISGNSVCTRFQLVSENNLSKWQLTLHLFIVLLIALNTVLKTNLTKKFQFL